MGNLKSGLADFLVSEDQNIQVQRSGAITNSRRTVTSVLLFDPQQAVEQRVGIERGLRATTALRNRGCSAKPTGSVE
jgi:hypothetical protein